MPWTCSSCQTEIAYDELMQCSACGAAKAAWTLAADVTRAMVVRRQKLELKLASGEEPVALDPGYGELELAEAGEEVWALDVDSVRVLQARGLLPPPRFLLVARNPGKGTALALTALGESSEAREVELPLGEPDPEGVREARILLVWGAAPPSDLPGVQAVEVTEERGAVPEVEVGLPGRGKPKRLRVRRAASLRIHLQDPDPEEEEVYRLLEASGSAHDCEPRDLGDGMLELFFTCLDVEGRYSLEIAPPDEPAYRVFEDVPYAELAQGRIGPADEAPPAAEDGEAAPEGEEYDQDWGDDEEAQAYAAYQEQENQLLRWTVSSVELA